MSTCCTGVVLSSMAPPQASGLWLWISDDRRHLIDLDNSNDLTFNQLLGINDSGVIAGYFGSGLAMHPNKGYYLLPRYGQLNYRVENFPVSTQTQVTGINNRSAEVGFQSPTDTGTDADYGWYSLDNGRTFTQVNVGLPSGLRRTPPPSPSCSG